MTTDREENFHRNNAAEWVMWACLLPLVVVVQIVRWVRRSE